MKRLVSVEKTNNSIIYHFENKEEKEKYKLIQESIIARSVQCNNSLFVSGMLGIAWGSL